VQCERALRRQLTEPVFAAWVAEPVAVFVPCAVEVDRAIATSLKHLQPTDVVHCVALASSVNVCQLLQPHDFLIIRPHYSCSVVWLCVCMYDIYVYLYLFVYIYLIYIYMYVYMSPTETAGPIEAPFWDVD